MTRGVAWLLAILAIAGSALLLGYRALESDADAAIEYPRNGKANHHPKHAVDSSE